MARTPSVVVVLGNRPQFIKHAAVHRAWAPHVDELRPVVVDTGQHYDYALNGVFLDELEIPPPDHQLGVGSASHAEQLARMLPPLEELLRAERAAAIVVYGDTNSTLGGALAASKLHVPILHVEAGLRSYDRTMPEEVNRVLTDHVSELLFCPTQVAVDNLAREGITGDHVRIVGDVMTDIAYVIAPAADARWPGLQRKLDLPEAGTFGVVTVHRASNTEQEALRSLIEGFRRAPIDLVFPMHPRTQHALEETGLHVELASLPIVKLLPPLGYVDLAAVLRHARVALTDSGGLQKEAYIHGVPCITLRDRTEWVETVDSGMNVLVHTSSEQLVAAVEDVMGRDRVDPADLPAHYGHGDAAERIVDAMLEHVGQLASPLG
jgi:UDP-N-acetylglucosamine 2-epimerase